MINTTQKFITIDGVQTAYHEAGVGVPVVLLHSGEHGACADLTWEHNFDRLAQHFRVLAPDWLGYGRTDKLYDFVSGAGRRLAHMSKFMSAMRLTRPHIIGASMGGALALRALTSRPRVFEASTLTVIGAGGSSPDTPARRALLNYDCTIESMRAIVEALFHDERWAADEAHVRRRYELSLEPGAWECAAAARLKNPQNPGRRDAALADTTAYELLDLPVLVIAGACDKIKEPGYGEQIVSKMPHGELATIAASGHMPNIEQASQVNDLIIEFLMRNTLAARLD